MPCRIVFQMCNILVTKHNWTNNDWFLKSFQNNPLPPIGWSDSPAPMSCHQLKQCWLGIINWDRRVYFTIQKHYILQLYAICQGSNVVTVILHVCLLVYRVLWWPSCPSLSWGRPISFQLTRPFMRPAWQPRWTHSEPSSKHTNTHTHSKLLQPFMWDREQDGS